MLQNSTGNVIFSTEILKSFLLRLKKTQTPLLVNTALCTLVRQNFKKVKVLMKKQIVMIYRQYITEDAETPREYTFILLE